MDKREKKSFVEGIVSQIETRANEISETFTGGQRSKLYHHVTFCALKLIIKGYEKTMSKEELENAEELISTFDLNVKTSTTVGGIKINSKEFAESQEGTK